MSVETLLWVRIVADVAVIVVVGFFIFKVWRMKARTERVFADIAEERALVSGLLQTIKGWTVVHVHEEERKAALVATAADAALALKRQVTEMDATLPDRTAAKVAERTGESNSGTNLPVVRPGDEKQRQDEQRGYG